MLYSFHPYLKYFALLGLVPWSESCAQSKFVQKVYSAILIILNAVHFGISIYFPQSAELFLSPMVNVIVFVARIVCVTVIILQVMVHYDDYFRFCREMKYLGLRLQCELKIHVGRLKWQSYAKILALGIGFLVTVLPSIYVALSGSLLYFWSSLLSILIIRMQFVLVLLNVELLGHHVSLLGIRLQNVLECHLMGANCTLDGNANRLCSLEFLLALKQSHMQLHYLFTHFNDLFGWSILGTYVVLFSDSTVNIYWTQQVLAEVYEYKYLYATFSVFVPSFFNILVFCRCGEFCQRQVIKKQERKLASASRSLYTLATIYFMKKKETIYDQKQNQIFPR